MRPYIIHYSPRYYDTGYEYPRHYETRNCRVVDRHYIKLNIQNVMTDPKERIKSAWVD